MPHPLFIHSLIVILPDQSPTATRCIGFGLVVHCDITRNLYSPGGRLTEYNGG
ncbi:MULTISPECIES: hypothetical protein [Parabacteroides]|uniref:hypothetical protein n=1 Tax=Parabacteroides TaxID=375288 RepID=UPI0004239B39|nr:MULTISPECIES: hypothetical protein [Parabacteroides]MCA5585972.1 hypothetical protein [Parabacteroides gordonii]